MLRSTRPYFAVQTSAAYKRLMAQLPKNLLFFDGMCPYCEHNVHWIMTKNLSYPADHDNVIHCCPIESPDAKYVLSHFPHLLYREADKANTAKPMDTMVFIEKRPNERFVSKQQKLMEDTKQKKHKELHGEDLDPTMRSGLLQDVEYDVKPFIKADAAFRIGMKLDDPKWVWISTACWYLMPRWFANERYDVTAFTRFDKYGRHTKLPRFSEEIRFRTWSLNNKAPARKVSAANEAKPEVVPTKKIAPAKK